MATPSAQWLCSSDNLSEGGLGVRFEVAGQAAFAIRYQGRVYAYLNQCRHIPVEMDYRDGDFFDLSKHYLICALHGATYQPDTGLCVRGPCRGSRLHSVKVEERDGQVYLVPPACNGENSQ